MGKSLRPNDDIDPEKTNVLWSLNPLEYQLARGCPGGQRQGTRNREEPVILIESTCIACFAIFPNLQRGLLPHTSRRPYEHEGNLAIWLHPFRVLLIEETARSTRIPIP